MIMLLEMIGIGLIFPVLKIITDNNFLADNLYFTQIQTSLNLERDIIGYILLLIVIFAIFFPATKTSGKLKKREQIL